ncbi:helicase-related protein [Kribbella sp. NPDC056345]|uniref:helicase-related protein n=1 Tax=Kribbella sp. NPDC056345 TaxID=3345789 RepID=UPI0035D8747E
MTTLATTPPSAPVLMPHQQHTVDFIVDHPFAGIWVDVGGGKTLSVLSALQRIRPIGHILVIAPIAVARSTWIDEIEDRGFNIRTRSLIVDERDRKLSRERRVQRFQQVFSDPPTMYFINADLLTQPSQQTRMITPVASKKEDPVMSAEAAQILQLVRTRRMLNYDELVTEYRDLAATDPGRPTPAKSKIHTWVQELRNASLVTSASCACRTCSGAGCPECRFGLVDQMPIQDLNGQKTLIWPFQTIIIDESHAFRSHSSNRFNALKAVRPAVTRLIELTATPAPNGLEGLWSQAYLLDQGRALGTDIDAYRQRWFTPTVIPDSKAPPKWKPKPGAEQEIQQAIAHLVMSAQNTSIKLPPLIVEDVHVRLPPDLMTAYRVFKRDLIVQIVSQAALQKAELAYADWLRNSAEPEAQTIRTHLATLTGDDLRDAYTTFRQATIGKFLHQPDEHLVRTVVADNRAVLISKLMQFASGTLYTSDPDDPSTKGQYEIIHDEKIQKTSHLIRQNAGEPALVAYHFKSDKEQLHTRLNKTGIPTEVFDGSRTMIHRWNAKDIPAMLIHPASAGAGLNLQRGGSTLIWYTLPFLLDFYQQTIGRVYRPGQTEPVKVYRIITDGTQDERMPGVLSTKRQLQDRLLRSVDVDKALLAALDDEIRSDLNDLWSTLRL